MRMWSSLSSRGIRSGAAKGAAASASGVSVPKGSGPAAALQRQQVRERAAAEGAEESSAPQARRECRIPGRAAS